MHMLIAASIIAACPADLNDDNRTDGRDLMVLLTQYGDEGDDPVALGQCATYAELDAWLIESEAEFRKSIADNPQSIGAPYPPMSSACVIRGDFNRNGVIDYQDLSVLLADFGCAP